MFFPLLGVEKEIFWRRYMNVWNEKERYCYLYYLLCHYLRQFLLCTMGLSVSPILTHLFLRAHKLSSEWLFSKLKSSFCSSWKALSCGIFRSHTFDGAKSAIFCFVPWALVFLRFWHLSLIILLSVKNSYESTKICLTMIILACTNLILGTYSCVCSGQSSGVVHIAGDILVRPPPPSRYAHRTLYYCPFSRDRMNLKYPVYFSQGLAEKVCLFP